MVEPAPQLVATGTWPIVIFLITLPLLQSLGTGNPLYFMAVNGFAIWAAVIVFVATATRAQPDAAQVLGLCLVIFAAVAATYITTTAYWTSPYRTAASSLATTKAEGVPALSSVALAPDMAEQYAAIHRALDPYITPGGRYMMAFDEMSGLVLALDGKPVGEAWYSAIDPGRSATNIRSECANGQTPWGDRLPIILFRRPPTATETAAFSACGIDFSADYKLVAPVDQTAGLQVYVPVNEEVAP